NLSPAKSSIPGVPFVPLGRIKWGFDVIAVPLRHVTQKTAESLLTAAFDDSSLMTLCFDRFHALYDEKLSRGMGKGEKIQSLLDYCLRQGQLGELLEFVKEHNPHQYSLHRERIFHSM
ncbi:MAG: hypothetical protein KKB13_11250, partial [Chloroflexi bacterium]|nr:hypothetical protein [Chloroflexota bacterium]